MILREAEFFMLLDGQTVKSWGLARIVSIDHHTRTDAWTENIVQCCLLSSKEYPSTGSGFHIPVTTKQLLREKAIPDPEQRLMLFFIPNPEEGKLEKSDLQSQATSQRLVRSFERNLQKLAWDKLHTKKNDYN